MSAGTASRDTYGGLAAAICIAISLTSVVNSSRAAIAGVTPPNSTWTPILPPMWMYWPDVALPGVADEAGHRHVLAELADGGGHALLDRAAGSCSQASVAASPAFSISASTSFTSCWKSSVRATKSDSQLTSTSVPLP